jgi:hypothetical protein
VIFNRDIFFYCLVLKKAKIDNQKKQSSTPQNHPHQLGFSCISRLYCPAYD